MAIDTKSISQLITEFRALQTKDSITPESLGYILQRLADLLATAGTSETVEKIQTLLDGFKTAGQALTSVVQGKTDRNHVYANIGKVSLIDGKTSTSSDVLFIQQATTERAGAMRAQQVTDLNATRTGLAAVQKQTTALENLLAEMQKILGIGDGTAVTSVVNTAQISCEVVGGHLHIHGAQKLISAGYVPYLFRFTRKRNQYHHKASYRPAGSEGKKYSKESHGWHVYGSRHAVKVNGEEVSFSTNRHEDYHKEAADYTTSVSALVRVHIRKNGTRAVGWGRSMVVIDDVKNTKKKKDRMLRFRYAIGFAKPIGHGSKRITPANLVSSLAEFSVIYDPKFQQWSLSR